MSETAETDKPTEVPVEAGRDRSVDATQPDEPTNPEPNGAARSDDEAAAAQVAASDGFADDLPGGDLASDDGARTYQRFDCTSQDETALTAGAEAARLAIERGECIVLPTDTVYGIGADAFNGEAVRRLLEAKMRGRDMPPPVLIADPSLIRVLAIEVPQAAKDLVAKYWPGPLTVICKVQPSLRMDLGDTEGTIALRVPDHELAREVLRRTGPMAVSSANISGQPAAVTCDEAVAQLGNSVEVYLDGGTLGLPDEVTSMPVESEPVESEPDRPTPPSTRLPSTIVDFTQTYTGQVLRHGAIGVELLRETCPDLEDLVERPDEPNPVEVNPEVGIQPQTAGREPAELTPESADQAAETVGPIGPAPLDTDQLRITHSVADPDQPPLFDPEADAEPSMETPAQREPSADERSTGKVGEDSTTTPQPSEG